MKTKYRICYHLTPVEYIPLILSQGLVPQLIKNRNHADFLNIKKATYLWTHNKIEDFSTRDKLTWIDKKYIVDLIFAKYYIHPRNQFYFELDDAITAKYKTNIPYEWKDSYVSNLCQQNYYGMFLNYIFLKVRIPISKDLLSYPHDQDTEGFERYSHHGKPLIFYTKIVPPKDIEMLRIVKATIKDTDIKCRYFKIKDKNKFKLTKKNIKLYSKQKLNI